MSAHPNGTRVRYGFTTGEIIRKERRFRQAGYVVWDDHPTGDYGATRPYPQWVPARAVTPIPETTGETE